ncbi:hypothetical protein H0H92_002024 [Tricholoma furcatifolium]|nr:hypothetical protein H0H92_002024 [Tricholoma furcatifolium]
MIERILTSTLPSPCPDPTRPHWLRSPNSRTTKLAPVYVSRQLNRIATPLLYHSIYLPSPSSACLLLHTLLAHPELQAHVRCIIAAGVWGPVMRVLGLCMGLHILDLTIAFDEDDEDQVRDHAEAVAAFKDNGAGVVVDPFSKLAHMRHLMLQKLNSTYLSLARLRLLILAIARAIRSWPDLRTADIVFKLADDIPTSPSSSSNYSPISFALPTTPGLTAPTYTLPPAPIPTPTPTQTGPISSLAATLASSPTLHTFSTHLPSVWNTAIMTIALNPALQKIVLRARRTAYPLPLSLLHAPPPQAPHPHAHLAGPTVSAALPPCQGQGTASSLAAPSPSPCTSYALGVSGTGLFLMEARRHLRLTELIALGMPIVCGRAHTLGRLGTGEAPGAHVSLGVNSTAGVGAGSAGLPSMSPSKSSHGVSLGLHIDTSGAWPVGPGSMSTSAGWTPRVGSINSAWMGVPLSSAGANALVRRSGLGATGRSSRRY